MLVLAEHVFKSLRNRYNNMETQIDPYIVPNFLDLFPNHLYHLLLDLLTEPGPRFGFVLL